MRERIGADRWITANYERSSSCNQLIAIPESRFATPGQAETEKPQHRKAKSISKGEHRWVCVESEIELESGEVPFKRWFLGQVRGASSSQAGPPALQVHQKCRTRGAVGRTPGPPEEAKETQAKNPGREQFFKRLKSPRRSCKRFSSSPQTKLVTTTWSGSQQPQSEPVNIQRYGLR